MTRWLYARKIIFLLPIFVLGFLSVTPSAYAATITITAPAVGASWQAGTTQTITWTPFNSNQTVTLSLIRISTNSVAMVIVSSTLNTGSYSWVIPTTVTPTTNDYKIYVQQSPSSAIDWGYSGAFSITAPASNAVFVSQTPPPSTMVIGQTSTVSVTMQNTGGDTWVQGGANPYRLGSQNSQDNGTWGLGRVNLPVASVAPGASVTFPFTITAPSTPGTYNYQWKMVHEGIVWFGAFSTNVAVTVTAPDTTSPTVSITAPAGGSTVSGTAVAVSANASDNIAVVGVQFKDGATNIGAEDTTSPYSVSWNTTTVANGSHTLTAVARDAAGNSATSAGVSVTVNNIIPDTTPPSVPTGLGAVAVSSSQIDLSWTASTDTGGSGLAGYNVYRNGGATAINTSLVTATSYSDTGRSPSTSYSYTVRAQDGASNQSGLSSSASAITQAPPPPPNVSGYAWAGNPDVDGIGWIHLSGTAVDGSPYGVLVSSASPGVLSGYAWANPNDAAAGTNNIGWIDFGPAGPYPASSFVPAQSARLNRTTGLVTGWARALAYSDAQAGGWDGWIGFGSGGNYTQPVSVSGCTWSGYAWGGGTTIGWIHLGVVGLYPVTGSGDGCVALPDLTAGAVSPTSATAGTATTFSATISNSTAPTGASFPYFFQVATAAGGGGTITDLTSSTMSALAASGSGASALATSPSYTFTTAGTYSVRACANKTDRNTFGPIVESSYSNNCTDPWKDITVTSPLLAGSFSANPDTIDPGKPSTLTWTSNATTCVGQGTFSTGSGNPANGNTIVSPTIPGLNAYQIICSKSGYLDLTLATTVTVTQVTASISAKPTCISGGGSSSKISWSVLPVSQIQPGSCRLSGPGLSSNPLPVSPNGLAPNASPQTAAIPNTKSTYTIACKTTGGGPITKSIIVDVSSCWTEF